MANMVRLLAQANPLMESIFYAGFHAFEAAFFYMACNLLTDWTSKKVGLHGIRKFLVSLAIPCGIIFAIITARYYTQIYSPSEWLFHRNIETSLPIVLLLGLLSFACNILVDWIIKKAKWHHALKLPIWFIMFSFAGAFLIDAWLHSAFVIGPTTATI